MCNRYDLHVDAEEIIERFSAMALGDDYVPSYNICPTDSVPTVFVKDGTRSMQSMRWGAGAVFCEIRGEGAEQCEGGIAGGERHVSVIAVDGAMSPTGEWVFRVVRI